MSQVTVTYGTDLFLNIGPQPIVSIDTENVYVNGEMHSVDTVTLNGRIRRDDCKDSGLSDLHTKVKTLLQRLNVGERKNLSITETIDYVTLDVYSWLYAIPISVSIDDNKWYDWVPYSIQFRCYKEGYFKDSGIINPRREISSQNNPDGTVEITITCSCEGKTTITQAIENARLFVYNNSALLQSDLTNLFWTQEVVKDAQPYLTSQSENFNRLTGEVSTTRTYILQDPSLGFSRGVLKFTRDISVDQTGEIVVSINGEHQGSFDSDTTALSFNDDIKNIDWHQLATEAVSSYLSDAQVLYSSPVNFSFNRNQNTNSISFSIEFSSKRPDGVYIIDQTRISNDIENSKKCIEVSVQIKSDLKNEEERWSAVVGYYSTFSIQDFAQEKWLKYGNTEPLNLNTRQNISYSENKFEGTIDVSASFCVDQGQSCGCLEDINYKYSFVPALKEYKVSIPKESEGCHYIEDLRVYKRASFSINGSVLPAACCSYDKTIFELKNRLNQICNSMFFGERKILDSVEISKQETGGTLSFSASWSAKKDPIIPEELL
jgi:hypothetical protein